MFKARSAFYINNRLFAESVKIQRNVLQCTIKFLSINKSHIVHRHNPLLAACVLFELVKLSWEIKWYIRTNMDPSNLHSPTATHGVL